jgi:hypothetical protein
MKMKRKFHTSKINSRCYAAWALPGELAYGPTRYAAIKILKHDLQ